MLAQLLGEEKFGFPNGSKSFPKTIGPIGSSPDASERQFYAINQRKRLYLLRSWPLLTFRYGGLRNTKVITPLRAVETLSKFVRAYASAAPDAEVHVATPARVSSPASSIPY